MLFKLSLTGIKGKLRDYLVLFSGLVMASAIFYMFESMATNKAFLESNSIISSVVMIFHLGSVLLAIITLVYILYANSFLMTMRQKDYAMFMMLGAKGRKIAQLIFVETLFIGILATIAGSAIGIGLSSIVNQLLTKQLDVKVTHFSPFNTEALMITFIFFIILFLVSAVINAGSMIKKPILTLLRASETPTKSQRKNSLLFVETFCGIAFLAVGYWVMAQVNTLGFIALVIALVTIILGTYLVFHGVLIFILQLLKRSDRLVLKKLNGFTFSQLSFRIQDYTRMLSMVAMLFALALGALTVGLGFRNEIPKMTDQTSSYDLVLNNAQEATQDQVDALKPTENTTYLQKEDDKTVYYLKDEFNRHPLTAVVYEKNKTRKTEYDGDKLAADVQAMDGLRSLELPSQRTKDHQVIDRQSFEALNLPVTKLQVVKVKDFMTALPQLKKLATENVTNNKELSDPTSMGSLSQKVDAYTAFNGMFSGFEFMGFFLGIAFLTMLASCLMFKILSGANSDVRRYAMLNKIGTRKGLLKASLRKEIGVLFLVPGILGVTHVLFGLQMFTTLLSEPYGDITLPFTIFFILYFLYYVLTIWLYSGIVLKKVK